MIGITAVMKATSGNGDALVEAMKNISLGIVGQYT